jgi:MFS family permease
MHDPTMDGYVIWALVFAGSVYSMYLAGRIAERRGRSFKTWASIAGIIGPLALPLLFLLPNPQRKDPEGPKGEKRPTDVISAGRPVIQGNADPDQLNLSFA